MTRGKKTCKILKEIRQKIAAKNDIEYLTSECHFQGECLGTCPKCEEEVRYLENELNKRRQLGKAVVIAGISLGVVGAFSACSVSKQSLHQQDNVLTSERRLKGVIRQPHWIDEKVIVENIIIKDVIVEDTSEVFIDDDVPPIRGMSKNEEMNMIALYSFLQQNLMYPKEAKKQGIQGTVVVEFVVGKNGKIGDAKVIVPLHPDCDKEVIRVIKEMPDWIPLNGKAVTIYYNLSIKFMLKDKNKI